MVMQANWKKPWTILFWILSGDKFTPEEGPGPESASRFGPRGFWGWLFASEAFIEEPEIQLNKSRFGDRGFFSWLFGSDRRELLEDNAGFDPPAGQDDERKNST